MSGWSEDAWRSVSGWYASILAHPFVVALGDGTLGEDVFARYLVDDAHYLSGYARALSALAARTDDADAAVLLSTSAAEGIRAERELHLRYLLPRGIDPAAPDGPEPTPTCRGYSGMVQALAGYAPVEAGLAAVLPCFRVYAEVGRAVLSSAPEPDHPYRAWIDAYADPVFHQTVRAVEAHTDAVAAATTEGRRDEMLAAYERATRYEWMFWDAAWRAESWPGPPVTPTGERFSDGSRSAPTSPPRPSPRRR